MNIAIEGCLHGELQQVYSHLLAVEKTTGITIDALLICGDFQATRDEIDLDYMHCPQKYKNLGSFSKYYTGQKKTPFLTIFIGGNHQAVNYMRDLYFGGWVAPNIYYLGQAGSIYITKGNHKIRVSGLSGIYNDYDFKYCLKTERIPLMGKSKISCYHIKQIQIFRMQLLSRIQVMKKQDPTIYGTDGHQLDIFLTHDWPKDITLYGNTKKLLQVKPFLQKQIQQSTLGCMPASRILTVGKPSYWFSAHMHVKFAALFPHPQNKFTHFLSLDKCLKNNSCLQLLRFQQNGKEKEKHQNSDKNEVRLELDRVWLAVLYLTYQLQYENRSLYKQQHNQKQVKLLDSKLMNSLIGSYASIKDKKYESAINFERNLIKWQNQQQKGEQIQQTLYLVKDVLGLDAKLLSGTILMIQGEDKYMNEQGEHAEKQNAANNEDEIDLQL